MPTRHAQPGSALPLISAALVVLCAALLPPLATAQSASGEAGTRPNIVLVYSDDHASAAVGSYGSPLIDTPHIDSLADEGVVFENAFCTNGICAPARAVVLTGQHSHVNGVRDNGSVFDGGRETFPKLLQAAGYQTALFGKWHLKTDPTGFDAWEVLPGQGQYYNPDFETPEGRHRRPGYVTDVVTDLALDWLTEGRDDSKPFLLMVQHKAPHRTWMPGPEQLDMFSERDLPEPATLLDDLSGRGTAAREQEMTIARHMFTAYDLKLPLPPGPAKGPDAWSQGLLDRMSPEQRSAWDAAFDPRNAEFLADPPTGDALVRWKYQRYIKNYLRCIASIDDNVGRLLVALDEQGLTDDTLFVYSSDQGFFLGENGWYDKRFMNEPSLRLPLIARWPGVAAPGTRVDELVQNLDMAPTFLAAAGVTVPNDVQGSDLGPLMRGEDAEAWRDSVYYEYFEKGIHNVSPHFGVRTDRYKLIRWPDHDEWELFDLQEDPDEVTDLHADPRHVGTRARLEIELLRLREEALIPEPGQHMPAREDLGALAWMTGHWRAGDDADVVSEEVWLAPRSGMMLGVNRMSSAAGDLFFENMRIELIDDVPVFIASPSGSGATPFPLESSGPGEASFTNPSNDYPQRVAYWLEGHDTMRARIELMDGSNPQHFGWKLFE